MRRYMLATTALIGAVALPHWAAAQVAPANQEPERVTTLEDIVVTAERRETTVQTTPLAITAISGDEILQEARQNIAEIIADAPGVQIQATPQGGQVFIRGVGANGDSNFIDPAISLMVDNVYTGRSESLGSGLYDVERVEILRGPQGTLYGRNATGGSVNVLTRSPGDAFGGALNVQMGDYDLRHVDGAINLPLSDTFAIRVAGLRETRDGYFSNGGRASDVKAARVKALWKPTENLSLLGFVDYLTMEGLNNTTTPRPGTLRATSNDPWYVDPYHPAEQIDRTFKTYGAQLDYDLPFGTLTAVAALAKSRRYVLTNLISGIEINQMTGLASSLQADTTVEKQKTLEIRLASPKEAPFDWVVGLYVLDSTNGTINTDRTSQEFGYVGYAEAKPTTSYAAFGQVTYPLTARLNLTGGVRYTKDRKQRAYGFTSLAVPGYPIYSTPAQTLTDSDQNVTWRVGLQYDFNPTSMAYANIATGYKAGGFGTTTFPPVAYDPETLTAFELGSKNRFLDNRLVLNIAAYYYRYENYQAQYTLFGGGAAQGNLLLTYLAQNGFTSSQIADYVAAYNAAYYPNGAQPGLQTTQFSQFVANADTGSNLGLEVETRYLLSGRNQVYLSFAANDSKYGDFSNPAFPSNITALSGQRVANAPRFTGQVGYEHTVTIGRADLIGRIETRLSSGYWTTVGDRALPGAFQEGYNRSSAFLTYRRFQADWSVTGWVKNIENDYQVTYIFPQNRRIITDPRTFGVSFMAEF